MNKLPSRKVHYAASFVATAAVAVLLFQVTTAARLRREQARLVTGAEPMDSAATASGSAEDVEALRQAAREAEQLRAANRDLHKLRNEVAQLRQQRGELDRAKTENQQLKRAQDARQERRALAKSMASQPGFVPQETWTDAGMASPEATLQTYFWCLREGKFDRLVQCLSPAEQQHSGKAIAGNQAEQQQITQLMKAMSGYRIAEKTNLSPDEIVFHIQAPIFTERANGKDGEKLRVKRINDEWKIEW
jgi:hypothetical protein